MEGSPQEPSPRRRRAEAVLGLDLRSLALFRMGLGAVLLYDLIDRSITFTADYADPGALPTALLPTVTNGAALSLHAALAGSPAALKALLALQFLAAIALVAGLHTRVATAVSWYLLVSLQLRNPLTSWEGADILLRVLLMWGFLLPLGARFSVDAWRRGGEQANLAFSPATAGLVLQILTVYWMTGLAKSGETWQDGSALEYALHVDWFGNARGAWLRTHHAILPWLTHASRWLELLGPCLLLVPWNAWLFRLLAFASFWGFHLGIWIFMSVGMFSPLMMVLWIAILPGRLWDAIGLTAKPAGPRAARGFRLRLLRDAAAVLLSLYLVAALSTAAASVFTGRPRSLPPLVDRLASALRIKQSWKMFAPDPATWDFWIVMRGKLADGGVVDAFRGGPPIAAPPPPMPEYLPNFKSAIALWWLADESRKLGRPHPLWTHFGEHLCRSWNATHFGSEHMVAVEIRLMLEKTRLRQAPVTVPSTVVSQTCPGSGEAGA